jgi:hypothetical protein
MQHMAPSRHPEQIIMLQSLVFYAGSHLPLLPKLATNQYYSQTTVIDVQGHLPLLLKLATNHIILKTHNYVSLLVHQISRCHGGGQSCLTFGAIIVSSYWWLRMNTHYTLKRWQSEADFIVYTIWYLKV